MKTKKLIYGVMFICMLAFVAGPMFGAVKPILAAEQGAKPQTAVQSAPPAKPEMQAPMQPAAEPAKAEHKKVAKKAVPSDQIKSVQKALNGIGFTLQEDGLMGKDTRQALKKFQKENGLKPTGKADKETLAKLGVQ